MDTDGDSPLPTLTDLYGGSDSLPAQVVTDTSGLTYTDLAYYVGGGDGGTVIPPGAAALDGTTARLLQPNSSGDLQRESNRDASGVQWGGADMLRSVSQTLTGVIQTAANIAGVAVSAVRKVQGQVAQSTVPVSSAPSTFPIPLLVIGGAAAYFLWRRG